MTSRAHTLSGRSFKVDLALLFTNLIEYSNTLLSLFLRILYSHSITVTFAELLLASLIQFSALNLQSKNFAIRDTREDGS